MSNNNRWHEIRGEVEGLSTCWFVALCHFALFALCVITNRVLGYYGIQFVADWVEFSLICMTAISGWLVLLFYGVRSAVASGMPEYVSIDVFGSEFRYKRRVE